MRGGSDRQLRTLRVTRLGSARWPPSTASPTCRWTIEGYELAGPRARDPRLRTALTTVIHLGAAARTASARTSPTTPSTTIALQDAGAPLDLTGHATLGEFCDFMGGVDTFPAEPQRDVSRRYRRWAFESAALDLALRQSGIGIAEALGREPRPVNFVCLDAALARRGRALVDRDPAPQARPLPGLRFKLDPTNDWTDELIAALVETGRRRLARPQGLLQRHPGRRRNRPRALREADRGLPRRLARGPRRQRRDPADPRAGPRPAHLGRADPLDRRHRGRCPGRRRWSTSSPRGSAACATSARPTTTATSTGSAPTAAASGSSASAAARSRSSPRSSIPTPRTTPRRAATTKPSRRARAADQPDGAAALAHRLPLGRIGLEGTLLPLFGRAEFGVSATFC